MPGQEREHQTLGDVLQAARATHGWSVRQLAQRANVHHSVLARIESGSTTQPSPELLQRIADALEIDVNELLGPVGVKPRLPEPRLYFRKKLGVSADEAEVLARLIEDHQAQQATQKPRRKRTKADDGD